MITRFLAPNIIFAKKPARGQQKLAVCPKLFSTLHTDSELELDNWTTNALVAVINKPFLHLVETHSFSLPGNENF